MARIGLPVLPEIIDRSGDQAARRFVEFFAVQIRNENTRGAYLRAVMHFLDWLEVRGVRELAQVEPLVVAAYIEELTRGSIVAPRPGRHYSTEVEKHGETKARFWYWEWIRRKLGSP